MGLEFTPRAVPHGSHLNDPPSREVEGVLAPDRHLRHLVPPCPPPPEVVEEEDKNKLLLAPPLLLLFDILSVQKYIAMGSLEKIRLLTEMIRKSPSPSPLTTTS